MPKKAKRNAQKAKAKSPAAKSLSKVVITTADAGELLMVTAEWVRQLVKRGHIEKIGKDRIGLVAVVQGYINFLKDEERRTSKSASLSAVQAARARGIELRTARDEGSLVPFDEAKAFMQIGFGLLMAKFNGLPAELTRDISERRRIEAAIDRIRGEVAAVLEEYQPAYSALSDADPADDENDTGSMGTGKSSLSRNGGAPGSA